MARMRLAVNTVSTRHGTSFSMNPYSHKLSWKNDSWSRYWKKKWKTSSLYHPIYTPGDRTHQRKYKYRSSTYDGSPTQCRIPRSSELSEILESLKNIVTITGRLRESVRVLVIFVKIFVDIPSNQGDGYSLFVVQVALIYNQCVKVVDGKHFYNVVLFNAITFIFGYYTGKLSINWKRK